MTVPVHGLPPLLQVGMRVAIVPPPLKGDRWHLVESSSEGGSGQLVRLSGIAGIGAAQELAGHLILADVDDLPAAAMRLDVDALMGRKVVDDDCGSIGCIEEVLRGAAQDVWVVRGAYGEVLVPVVDEFVLPFGAEGPIRVCLPDGLMAREGE